MNTFIKELEAGDIHLHDRWQFELKSEFFPSSGKDVSSCTQEFYFFIPNALSVNEDNYSKSQFYQDETNLIRFKTPEFQLSELADENNLKSPLTRLTILKDLPQTEENINNIKGELKLFGNVVRSSLRERIRQIFNAINIPQTPIERKEIDSLCKEISDLRNAQLKLSNFYIKNWSSSEVHSHLIYLDEFVSNAIDYYLTGLLEWLSRENLARGNKDLTAEIFHLLEEEKRHREEFLHIPPIQAKDSAKNELVMYRRGLLNKFVMDALMLPTFRSSLDERFRNIIGSISAGIAMTVFLFFFVWQGKVFLINSLPFIFATVILYILKDRMKEGLKALSYRQFYKWFSDYTTDIRSPDGKFVLGKLSESFSFVNESKLPEEILKIRNREFHSVLETFKRPEQVIYYKKIIKLFPLPNAGVSRRHALNLIFRFNISHFLRKADNPTLEYVTVDLKDKQLLKMELPKVYHINIIIKNTYILSDHSAKIELKKFRIVADKRGLKRVELVNR